MPAGIPGGHPLARLFASLTERNFAGQLGWPDAEVIGYLTGVLTDFVHVDRLFRIRNAQGRRVEEVAEMLLEGDVLLRARSVQREREVHRHIGDYTLFMSGVFPEFVGRLKRSRSLLSPDALLDFVQVGKRSYRVVSEFAASSSEEPAALFRKLSENFELCVYGLGYVRADLDHLRDPRFQAAKGQLLG